MTKVIDDFCSLWILGLFILLILQEGLHTWHITGGVIER